MIRHGSLTPEHTCHVDDCGRSCSTCGDRITCMGADPVAVACSVHNDECADCGGENPCRDCATIRRCTAAAERAWSAELDPTWIDPRNQADIDTAAENRRDDRAYELAHLEDREEQSRYGAA